MRETFPIKLLLQLFQATPEQLVAIERLLGGQALPDWRKGAPASLARQVLADESLPADTKTASDCVFRRPGRLWEVVFAGGGPFHLENTLGARYLDYLLHPNDPISAFSLEVAIEPEKGEARSTTSIQRSLDARARREYDRALRELRADKEGAQEEGDPDEISRLDSEIGALELALYMAT